MSANSIEQHRHKKGQLYPPIMPYSSGFMAVDETHNLYWEQNGNPDGVPILLLHGGPGAGASPMHRQFFDPHHYRIIIFDQRGAGRSQPLGELKDNATTHLVQDIEALRQHLGVDKWHIFGGSWGSTLALAYAKTYPDHCVSMILRGIFLLTQSEVEWFLRPMGQFYPEAWESFTENMAQNDPETLLNHYYDILTGDNEERAIAAAQKWCAYEEACSRLIPEAKKPEDEDDIAHNLALAKIEAHYFKHEAVNDDQSLLNHIDPIRHIPTTIIQGRYDVICPISTAHKLHLAWPEADYIIVPDGGHSATDPAIRARLIEATDNARHIRS